MALSFRAKLLVLFTLVLSIALGTTVYLVYQGTTRSIEANAAQDLDVALAVFRELLQENGERLRDSNLILTDDFALKRAISTHEDETIFSVLDNHSQRIGADLVILMNADGEPIIGSYDNIDSNINLSRLIATQEQGLYTLVMADGIPYQLVVAPVRAPDDPIAWVGMGFALDQTLVQRLKGIANADISLVYEDQSSPVPRIVSTMDELQNFQFASGESIADSVDEIKKYLMQGDHLVASYTLLDDDQGKLYVLLSNSLQQEFASFRALQNQIIGFFAAALVVALIVIFVISRSVTRPIESLVTAAKRIAKGNYRQAIRIPEKNELGLLGQTLNIMQGAINQREEHITFQAQHDLLTRLPNRNHIRDLIKNRLDASLDKRHFALGILQFHNLNQLSDVYGTDVRDELIKQIADRLRDSMAAADLLARIGNNEFLVFFDELPRDQIGAACEMLFQSMDKTFRCGTIDVQVASQMGVALCPEDGDEYDDLLRRAYIALSRCGGAARRVSVYQLGEEEDHLRKIQITSRLQQAIKHGAFELIFHPQFDVKTRTITHCEVLLRWHDDELGLVDPGEFIPLAEHSGDIVHITRWVFTQSLEQLQRWQAKGIKLSLCINLSARDILSEKFIRYVLDTLDAMHIDRGAIVLEITETAMIENPAQAIRNLQVLYDAGIHLAMDDFGTGFSSLSQLKAIPLHELKIDKSFVLNLDNDGDDQKIVKATIEMAHNLDLRVVAEGVETESAFNLLQTLGCDVLQGYFLTTPLPSAELEQWLVSNQHTLKKVAL